MKSMGLSQFFSLFRKAFCHALWGLAFCASSHAIPNPSTTNKTPLPFDEFSKHLALGKTSMEVSTQNTLAKKHFLLGLTFLHAFMYDLAITQFQTAQKLDPGFAMAYWGEAMANKHTIWHYENRARGQAILNAYEQHKDKRKLSLQEQAYLQSSLLLFSQQPSLERDQQYAASLEKLYEKYPEDPNIGAFYALSLLGITTDFPQNKNNLDLVTKGRAIITALLQKYPTYTGVLHYYIHYYDTNDNGLAKKALPAANSLLTVAASSSHLTHMASHIYRQLGLWNPLIHANELSIRASKELCHRLNIFAANDFLARRKQMGFQQNRKFIGEEYSQPAYACDADNRYHSLEWLQYGYLQEKRYPEAQKMLDEMATVVKQDGSLKYLQWYYTLWARQVLFSQDWAMKPLKIMPISQAGETFYWSAYAECGGLLASGVLAIHQNQPTEPQLSRLTQIIQMAGRILPDDPYIQQSCQIARLEVLKARAEHYHDLSAVTQHQTAIIAIQKRMIQSESTPSLSFLSAHCHGQ